MADSKETEERVLIAREELHAFLVRAFQKAGAARNHACALADVVAAADYRGHFSHGLRTLEYYMKDLLASHVSTARGQEPEVVKETAATALVDGHNLLGPVVGTFAMDLAIRKAREVGIGWVSVRGDEGGSFLMIHLHSADGSPSRPATVLKVQRHHLFVDRYRPTRHSHCPARVLLWLALGGTRHCRRPIPLLALTLHASRH